VGQRGLSDPVLQALPAHFFSLSIYIERERARDWPNCLPEPGSLVRAAPARIFGALRATFGTSSETDFGPKVDRLWLRAGRRPSFGGPWQSSRLWRRRKIHLCDQRLIAGIRTQIANEGIDQKPEHASIVRLERPLQPFEGFLFLPAHRVNLRDLIG
jgi:hypothetical protein